MKNTLLEDGKLRVTAEVMYKTSSNLKPLPHVYGAGVPVYWLAIHAPESELNKFRLETLDNTPLWEVGRSKVEINYELYVKYPIKLCKYEKDIGLDHLTKRKGDISKAVYLLLEEKFNVTNLTHEEIESRLFPPTTVECFSWDLPELPELPEE